MYDHGEGVAVAFSSPIIEQLVQVLCGSTIRRSMILGLHWDLNHRPCMTRSWRSRAKLLPCQWASRLLSRCSQPSQRTDDVHVHFGVKERMMNFYYLFAEGSLNRRMAAGCPSSGELVTSVFVVVMWLSYAPDRNQHDFDDFLAGLLSIQSSRWASPMERTSSS